jgi:hypothetical protein
MQIQKNILFLQVVTQKMMMNYLSTFFLKSIHNQSPPHALYQITFSHLAIYICIYYLRITVTRIELTVFPLGSAVLFFTLNWNPKRSISYVSIEELRTWLFLSKFRHKSIILLIFFSFHLFSSFQRVSRVENERKIV